jgi:hypothetical protein
MHVVERVEPRSALELRLTGLRPLARLPSRRTSASLRVAMNERRPERYLLVIALTARLTPTEAEQFASEVLADAREHLLAGERIELVRVEPER